jgi:hypothetical protein
MIQPLRRAHLWTWLALAFVLPLLLAASVLVRREPSPRNANLDWNVVRGGPK